LKDGKDTSLQVRDALLEEPRIQVLLHANEESIKLNLEQQCNILELNAVSCEQRCELLRKELNVQEERQTVKSFEDSIQKVVLNAPKPAQWETPKKVQTKKQKKEQKKKFKPSMVSRPSTRAQRNKWPIFSLSSSKRNRFCESCG
jgi:hypothetical protein